jgi:hypothetical protein
MEAARKTLPSGCRISLIMHALTKPTFLENTAGMERGGTRGAVTFRDMVHVQTIGGELEEIRRYIISWFKTRPGEHADG